MATPGGKRGGRVSVLVIPDATRFRNDLKLMLKRVEQSMSANILVTADVSGANADVRKFVKDWDGKKVNLAATMNTLGAATQLKIFSRQRFIDVSVRLRKDSLAKVGTAIAALSGARLGADLVENLANKLENLDRALPKIAAIALSVASIGASALASVGGVFTLGAGLVSILGVTAALPGILAGLAVGGTVLGLALSDTGDRLADLKPDFVELKTIVSDNFWGVAGGRIRDFVANMLPSLRDGLGKTATSVGTWASSVVQGFQTALGGGVIDSLFANLLTSIDIASTGTGAFTQAIVTLGAVGGAYLPRLAQWTADLSARFASFIAQVSADGSLQAFIDGGIVAAQQLGSALASIGSILSGVFAAAEAAGGGGLASFASVLAQVAEAVNSPAFQSVLTQFFVGAEAGAQGLATALGPIGAMFTALAPTISQILSSSGAALGQFLGSVASALSSPAFSSGLGLFFSGIQTGLAAIAPVLPQVAAAFGSFLAFAGLLASNLGPVLATLLGALAPAFISLLSAVTPLLPVLGDALIGAVTAIVPLFSQLITTLLPPLVELFSTLVPALLPLVEAILPVIAALLPPLVAIITALLPILTPLLEILTPILQILAVGLVPTIGMLTPLFEILGQVLTVVANILSGVLGTALLLIVGLINGDMSGALNQIGALWSSVWNNISAVFGQVWQAITGLAKGAISGIAGLMAGFINGVIGMVNGLIGAINGAGSALSAISGGVVNFRIAPLPPVSVPSLAVGATILPQPGGTLARLAEAGRAETVVDYGKQNRLLDANAALAKRALAVGVGGGTDRPIYTDAGVLIGWMRQMADGVTRLILGEELAAFDAEMRAGGPV